MSVTCTIAGTRLSCAFGTLKRIGCLFTLWVPMSEARIAKQFVFCEDDVPEEMKALSQLMSFGFADLESNLLSGGDLDTAIEMLVTNMSWQ